MLIKEITSKGDPVVQFRPAEGRAVRDDLATLQANVPLSSASRTLLALLERQYGLADLNGR